MIAEVGPYYSFGSFEGLWVRDEHFQFSSTGLAKPIKPAISVQNRPATWRNSRQTGNTGPNTVFDIGSGGLPG